MSYHTIRYSTLEDWLRLRPVLGLYKVGRRFAIGRAYCFKPAPDPAALQEICSSFGARPLVMTIAYNAAWMLAWQAKFAKLNFTGIDRLIADNSSDPEEASKIEALCRDAGMAYLKLPFNRFSLGRPKDPSLSHAVALNWVWQRIVRRVRPPVAAILDHDLIPLRPVDFASKVADQPFYGARMNGADDAWQVWPGYAVFDGSLIDRYDLDFWVDGSARLDTGGANWRRLYRHFDGNRLRFADGAANVIGKIDEWFHVGGASQYDVKVADWREQVEANLQREYEACLNRAAAPAR